MFLPMSQIRKKSLFKAGYLHYRRSIQRIGYEILPTIHVPCLVNFISNEQSNWPHNIFNFELSLTEKVFIIGNLTEEISNYSRFMDEQVQHFFLEWTIIEAQKWAKESKKECIMIETILPHCTEHFVEHGYDIKHYSSFNSSRGYRGIKELR